MLLRKPFKIKHKVVQFNLMSLINLNMPYVLRCVVGKNPNAGELPIIASNKGFILLKVKQTGSVAVLTQNRNLKYTESGEAGS